MTNTALQILGIESLPKLFVPNSHAAKRFIEFFTAHIRNPNTRRAYAHAVQEFGAWCMLNGFHKLRDIEPVHVAAYIETLQTRLAAPSVKQHLAAIRMLFNWLVVGQVLAVNPASPVRGPKHSVKKGKTPVLTAEEARALLDSISPDSPMALRDRALIALMVYTFSRVGAALKIQVQDVYIQGKRTWVRLHEKGKFRSLVYSPNSSQAVQRYQRTSSTKLRPKERVTLASHHQKAYIICTPAEILKRSPSNAVRNSP